MAPGAGSRTFSFFRQEYELVSIRISSQLGRMVRMSTAS